MMSIHSYSGSGVYRRNTLDWVNDGSTWTATSGSGTAVYDVKNGYIAFYPLSPSFYNGVPNYHTQHSVDSWSMSSAGVNHVSGEKDGYDDDMYGNPTSYSDSYDQTVSYANFYGSDSRYINGAYYPHSWDTQTGYRYSDGYLFGLHASAPIDTSTGSSMLITAMAAYAGETSFTYDESGNLDSLTDPVGNTTTWVYDENNQVVEETDALDNSRYYAYDENGQLTRYTDANGAVRTYAYDAAGNVTQETWYADATDADNEINALNTIDYTYDSAGRMLSETDDASSIVYTYSEDGLVTSVTESSDLTPTVVYAYAYNDAELVSSVAVTIGGVSDYVDEYAYDSTGQLTAISRHGVTGGNAVADIDVTLSYNELGQVASITRYEDDELVVTADYVYDADGLLVGLVYHQGDTILTQYAFSGVALYATASVSPLLPGEGQGVRAGLSMLPTCDTTGIEEALSESSIGQLLTTVTSSDGSVTYTYDALGQLLSADYSNESLTDESYTYDANGNRVTANGSTYTTGLDNQLLSDGTYTYAYANEGNRVLRYIDADEDGEFDAGDTDATVYAWDARNRLVEVTSYATFATYSGNSPSQVVDYFYDVENRWIAETIDSDGDGVIDCTIGYSYDGDQITLQFKKTGSGPLNLSNLSDRYLWQANAVDQLMADEQVTTPSSPGNVVWPLANQQGTINDLASYDSETGITAIANHRVYDSYGNLKSQTNAAVDCLFGYTGRAFDEATGSQYNTTRWYDPKVGRWENEDWIRFNGRDTNTSRYCGNSPINATDSEGTGMVVGRIKQPPKWWPAWANFLYPGSKENWEMNAGDPTLGMIAPIGMVAQIPKLATASKGAAAASKAATAAPKAAMAAKVAGKLRMVSRISESSKLVRAAEAAGKSAQGSLNNLAGKLAAGNLNPGIGTKAIGKGILEARARDGARIYFRQLADGTIEILGKSTKANQDEVIAEILRIFGN